MLLRSSRIVVTRDEITPYKVVLERETEGTSEYPVSSIREGEALIRENLPTPINPLPDPWNEGKNKVSTSIPKFDNV